MSEVVEVKDWNPAMKSSAMKSLAINVRCQQAGSTVGATMCWWHSPKFQQGTGEEVLHARDTGSQIEDEALGSLMACGHRKRRLAGPAVTLAVNTAYSSRKVGQQTRLLVRPVLY